MALEAVEVFPIEFIGEANSFEELIDEGGVGASCAQGTDLFVVPEDGHLDGVFAGLGMEERLERGIDGGEVVKAVAGDEFLVESKDAKFFCGNEEEVVGVDFFAVELFF